MELQKRCARAERFLTRGLYERIESFRIPIDIEIQVFLIEHDVFRTDLLNYPFKITYAHSGLYLGPDLYVRGEPRLDRIDVFRILNIGHCEILDVEKYVREHYCVFQAQSRDRRLCSALRIIEIDIMRCCSQKTG